MMVNVLDCDHIKEKFGEEVIELLSFHKEVFADGRSSAVDPDADG